MKKEWEWAVWRGEKNKKERMTVLRRVGRERWYLKSRV